MQEQDIQEILDKQHDFFSTGATRSLKSRQETLRKLEDALRNNEERIYAALKEDLGKSTFESYMCELGLVFEEIKWMKKKLPSLVRKKSVKTPVTQMIARSYQYPMPYGTVLIMSPWNYPILLTLDPLVDALAAGNTVMLKPSAYSPATAEALHAILSDAFPQELVAVILGGRKENNALLKQKVDKIFFTGSGQRSDACCGGAPNARHAGTRRKKPVYRGRNLQSTPCGEANCIRQIHELRTNLCCARLYYLPRKHTRGTRAAAEKGD